MTIKTVLPTDVHRRNQETNGIKIIDVREVDEFVEISSPLAENFPLSTFDADAFAKKFEPRTEFYMLCRSGKRSLKAAQLLEAAGFESIYNIEGGMIAWEESGLPVVRRRG